MIMDRLYGGVCYAGIDTDPELKYPKGAGRVAFSNQQSYIAAISARFVQLQHGEIDKRVSPNNISFLKLKLKIIIKRIIIKKFEKVQTFFNFSRPFFHPSSISSLYLRWKSSHMSWMTSCVTSARALAVAGSLPLSSALMWPACSTIASTAGQPSTPGLAASSISRWWRKEGTDHDTSPSAGTEARRQTTGEMMQELGRDWEWGSS